MSEVSLNLKMIARIESCYRDRFAVPRQSLIVEKASAFIRLEPWVQPELALEGLADFSHLWVIFGFHLNKKGRYHSKVHPPRLGGKTIGVFATRSPHRPNPIGLSLVEIKKVSSVGIEVCGGDFADGTPVYDLKPYLPETECQVQARAGWSSSASQNRYPVEFASAEIGAVVEEWSKQILKPDLKEIIFETLALDPRPLVYRDVQKPFKETHAFRLFNGDIHFKIENNKVIVCGVRLCD